MNNKVNDKLKAIFKEVFDLEITDQNLTRDDISKWDSMGHLGLILEIEMRFGTSFSVKETMEMISTDIIKQILHDHGIQ